MKDHTIPGIRSSSQDNSAETLRDVKSLFLPRDGSRQVSGNVNMRNNKIINLSSDTADVFSAANVRYVSQAKAETVATLTNSFNKKINESHISSSTDKKDVFRYLMEDVDESACENNIFVNSISDFPASPHVVNKKAYSFRMGKGAANVYFSRLSFNSLLVSTLLRLNFFLHTWKMWQCPLFLRH